MKKPVTLPCSAEAASMIIGNHGFEGYGTYIKLLEIIYKLPDQCIQKDRLTHIVTVSGMDAFLVDRLIENPALFIADETRIFPVEEKVFHKSKKPVDKPQITPQHKLQLYIINGEGPIQFPRVKSLEKQLSVDECESLIKEFPKQLIKETLVDMENWGKLTANPSQGGKTSVYLTLVVWCRRSMKNGWFAKKVEEKIRATA